MARRYPLVEVVWEDAWGEAEETRTAEQVAQAHRPVVMQTIGWLLKDNKKGVSVANERCLDNGEEVYRGQTFVPRPLIRSVTRIQR